MGKIESQFFDIEAFKDLKKIPNINQNKDE